jgi:hypothetical protein
MALSVGLWRTPLVCVGLMRWPRSSKIGKFGLTNVAVESMAALLTS